MTGEDNDPNCLAGALTQPEYGRLLVTAGFADVTITSTSQAADGLHAAIIKGRKPVLEHPADAA